MPGYLLAAAFHKQAFASATQHQLLAFLQVAAFTNRTAVLPFARVGEPAFVGLPRPGFGGLDRYFDVAGLAARWPCLRAITYDAFRREAPRARIVALQLGLPPGRAGSVVAAGCGRRSRPLVALGATFACASAALAASASATLGDATRWRRDAVIVTNWSQKLVGLGDAASPLFGDAFAARGGCQDARAGRDARAFPPLAPRWHARADAFLAASPVLRERAFVCAHVRAARPRRTRRARSARPSSQRSPARARPYVRTERRPRSSRAPRRAARSGTSGSTTTRPARGRRLTWSGARRPSQPSRRARPRADRSSCSPTPPRRTARRRTRAALASASGAGAASDSSAPCSRQRPRTAARSPPRSPTAPCADGADYHHSRAAARACRRRTFPPRRSPRRPSAAARPRSSASAPGPSPRFSSATAPAGRRPRSFSRVLRSNERLRSCIRSRKSVMCLSRGLCPSLPSRGGHCIYETSAVPTRKGRLDYNARLVYNVVCLRHRV